jgi:NDP-sugar pyrophosphorylase family protein
MPMLAFPYHWLDTCDLTDAVFNTHYLPDTVRQAAMHVVKPSTQLHFTHEESILGSGGGIWNARFHLNWDKTFAVANADGVVTFREPDAIEQMLRFHESRNALATLLVCPLEGVGVKNPGVWCDPYGGVVNFGLAPKKDNLQCLHYASYAFFSERIWDFLPEGPSNILYDVLEPAIQRGESVYAFRSDTMNWFETGNVADYLKSTRRCLEILRQGTPEAEGLRAMLARFAPDYSRHSDFQHLRLVDDASRVENLESLRGFGVIGAGATISTDTNVQDCVVLPGARVGGGRAHRDEVLM